ncbi:PAS domain S-box protein [Desulforhabdus sp. TSK]|uniref:PAS domain S-box protein n=1 Tax=Desulforhabdus sp. TSK TaxID=2925014 RepID=UPI001FC8B85B|nr:PAS domain S-box protein [Desulforhabdus sp. TSK]GKT06897.1 hypothetical protein DSTSK_02020 [Desulforhabdus sp. TSK]
MTLRWKTAVILILTTTILMSILISLSDFFFRKHLTEHEHLSGEDLSRVLDAFSDSLTGLENDAENLAQSDAIQGLLATGTSNTPGQRPQHFNVLKNRFSLIMCTNTAGEIVLARFLDSKTNKELPLPLNDSRGVPLARLFNLRQSQRQPLSRILTLPSGPVMVAVHSILDATGKDSSIGVLMVGRSLDSSELRRIERITRLNLAFYRFDDETAPQDFKAAAASLSPQRPVLIRQLEETVTAGYTLLQDIDGSPALIFRAINPSAHHAHILTNMRSFIVPVSVVGFGVTLLTLLLLEKLILSPLARLSAFVQTVRSTENLSARATIHGNDEVSALATAVNGMLEVLEKDVAARRRAEEALRKSEERLKQIVQNMPVLLLAMDEKGNILAWNRECERVTGYKDVEMVGNPNAMAGLYPDPAYRERFLARWREDGGDFFHEEWTLTDGDGRLKTVAWSNASSRLPISGWTTWGTGVDITERKRAEEKLRHYQLLSRYARDIILFVRLDGQIAETNDEAVRAYGYSREELLGLNVRDLRAQTTRTGVDLQMEEANLKGIRFQTVHRRKDGSTFPVEVSSRGANIGSERFILSIVRDISDRMAADDALKKSEATLKSVLMAAPIGIGLLVDRVLRLTNAHMLNMLGYTEEELQGKSSRILYENDGEYDRVGVIKYSEIHRSGSGSIETRWRCKNGKVLDILLNSNAIQRQDLSQGIIFTALDITERRRAEEEKRRLEAQIQHAQKLESLGILAGGIAHDFNNLLMAILGNADLALMEISPSDPARDNIISIMEASQRAADLCLQMLAYSGKGHFLIEPVNLAKIVQEMTHLLDVSISKKAVLKYSFVPDVPLINADATQIRQVVMNLITNASEAIGDKSGIISISTGAMMCDRAYLQGSYLDEQLPEGVYSYFEVSDTGSGMDVETRSKIFDPFFSTKFTGRGLGLAAVLGIVRGHKGAVKIMSEPGMGSTFRVLFPSLAETEVWAERKKPAGTTPWKGTGTVLIVDDDESVLTVGKQMLERFGFSVMTASDGHEALKVFRQHSHKIACVLLDLTMPHMDGEETFGELRRIRHDVCTILCSGYNEHEVGQRFSGKGLCGFLQKPYQMEELGLCLRKALETDPS